MRRHILLLSLALAACATADRNRGVLIETTSKGQPLEGASCVVRTDSMSTTVTTPSTIPPLAGSSDLRVICDKAGYRTSEFLFRPSGRSGGSSLGVGLGGGGGHVGVGVGMNFPLGSFKVDYPSRITVDMNPQ